MPKDMAQTSATPAPIYKTRESNARSYCRSFTASFDTAKGSELFTEDGTRYIDFLAGCSSLNYGHNDPDMKDALVAHILKDGITHGLDFHTEAKEAFLSTFTDLILKPRGMDHKVMFTGPTGANAVEAAMKIARKVTGRTNIISFTNGFHGVTMGALAATGNGYHRGGAGMSKAGVTRMPYDNYAEGVNSAALLDKMLSDPSGGIDAPAAIMLEVVQGEGGLNAASAEFVKKLEQIAHDHGALLIIDDIQAGCGRTGTFFSFEEMGVKPDVVTMAKSLSGFGLPMALVLVRPEHDVFGPAEHNGTFRGNTHAFVTARVAIEKFWADDAFQTELARKAALVTHGLQEVADLVPGATLKGRGLMQGVDVGSGELASEICARAYELGLVVETSGPNDEVVKILAPLTTPEAVFVEGFAILTAATRDIIGRAQLAAL
ncbi:diaminobutyrate--2-oxoglutarate transaminase [Arenibacterium sp. LLYu02]|uniref:diaminobutyrate--2-oxoglutarate transaminase n=1 Tax=Arenibacterium sp. LLYu02 TaxID=3404132 RepID=UPI003B219AE3